MEVSRMFKLALVMSCASLFIGVAIAARGAPPKLVALSPDDLAWADVKGPDGALTGLRTVDLWGQAAKGAHGSLTKFPAGLAERPHTHSRDLRVVVIAGTMAFSIDGGETKDLGPGSFVTVPAGVSHAAICRPAGACEVFLQQSGPMDVTFVGRR
jgi:quercetin dioxygenase-like cupin family protein